MRLRALLYAVRVSVALHRASLLAISALSRDLSISYNDKHIEVRCMATACEVGSRMTLLRVPAHVLHCACLNFACVCHQFSSLHKATLCLIFKADTDILHRGHPRELQHFSKQFLPADTGLSKRYLLRTYAFGLRSIPHDYTARCLYIHCKPCDLTHACAFWQPVRGQRSTEHSTGASGKQTQVRTPSAPKRTLPVPVILVFSKQYPVPCRFPAVDEGLHASV